jgi:hypothetical protein
VSETFLILRRNERDIIKNVYWSSCKNSFPILMKLECSPKILEKFSNLKFHENPSSCSRVVPCGRTDMKELIVAFRNFANAPKKNSLYDYHVHLPPCDLVSVTEPFQGFSSNAVQDFFTKSCGANESSMTFGAMRAHDLFAR